MHVCGENKELCMRRLLAFFVIALLIGPAPRPGLAASDPVRIVNAPGFAQSVNWPQAAVFWFGKVGWDGVQKAAPVPGPNYADVRVAYTPQALHVLVSVIDYYLWANQNPQSSADLTQYDAAALFIDTQGDRAAAPDANDYRFLSGWRGGDTNDARWHRQARGTSTGWDATWQGAWTDKPGSQWCGPGPNNNTGCFDYGWADTFTIPWATLGLSGPPAGKTIGLALRLYDRDDAPPAGAGPAQTWPETLDDAKPSTWGGLHIGLAAPSAPFASSEGSVTIRRGEGASQVADASIGSDGNCSGGHNGNPDGDNRGVDGTLYIASQAAITDFPCFARTYLRFGLGPIPAGKVIISAQLILHHWGNGGTPSSSNPSDRPQASRIQLLRVDGGWSESTITWNNSPAAIENLAATDVQPLSTFPGWPGVAITWDATAAVAAAYTAGQPLNLALYEADTEMHSGKYFVSSEAEDWNKVGRPTLLVTWGTPTTPISRIMLPLAVK
jgi:hypothetical protein